MFALLGLPEVRIPGSLRADEDDDQLAMLEQAQDPTSAMAKNMSIRENARIAQIKLDTDSRIRRALLRQSTPTRGPLPVGSYVYFLRQQAGADERGYKWYGPSRIIGVELRNPHRSEDQDPPTDGGQPHAYWLRCGPSVVLVTGEQLRYASEDELLAAHVTPQHVLVHLRPYALPIAMPAGQEEEMMPPAVQDQDDEQPSQAPSLPSAPLHSALPLPSASAEQIGSTDPVSPTRSTRPRAKAPRITEAVQNLRRSRLQDVWTDSEEEKEGWVRK